MSKITRISHNQRKTLRPLSMCLSPTSLKTLFWWLLLLGILTLYIFLGLGSLTSPTAIAAVHQSEAVSVETLYPSLTKLDD